MEKVSGMVKFSRVLQAVFVPQALSATIPFNLRAANDSLTSCGKHWPQIHADESDQTKGWSLMYAIGRFVSEAGSEQSSKMWKSWLS